MPGDSLLNGKRHENLHVNAGAGLNAGKKVGLVVPQVLALKAGVYIDKANSDKGAIGINFLLHRQQPWNREY